jgi:hypothetical protein
LFTLVSFFNYISGPNICAIFSHENCYVLILTKSGLGYILGDFFINSSGHPAAVALSRTFKSTLFPFFSSSCLCLLISLWVLFLHLSLQFSISVSPCLSFMFLSLFCFFLFSSIF